MAQKHTAFSLRQDASRLLVRGYLDGSEEVRRRLSEGLAEAKRAGKIKRLVIDASDAHTTPDGLSTWIEAVEVHLTAVALHYADSQLADLLQLDDRPLHPESTFDGSDLTANLPPASIKLPDNASPHSPPPRRKALAW